MISVILCTRDPRPELLNRTLRSLRDQELPVGNWELVVVDNGSTPPLAPRIDISWHPAGRVVPASTPGLTHARLRGFAETRGELVVMVDDDNELSPDYLGLALRISVEWPRLGAWGGSIEPVFLDGPPAEWTRPYWAWLAIRPVAADLWSNLPHERAARPRGAGMCLRRAVVDNYVRAVAHDPRRLSLDRVGTKLLGSGDDDIAMTACDLGLGNGLFAALRLEHLIPGERLTEDYLLRIVRSTECSFHLLNFIRTGVSPLAPSRSERLYRWYRHRRLPARQRRFEAAQQAGLLDAVRMLALSAPGDR